MKNVFLLQNNAKRIIFTFCSSLFFSTAASITDDRLSKCADQNNSMTFFYFCRQQDFCFLESNAVTLHRQRRTTFPAARWQRELASINSTGCSTEKETAQPREFTSAAASGVNSERQKSMAARLPKPRRLAAS